MLTMLHEAAATWVWYSLCADWAMHLMHRAVLLRCQSDVVTSSVVVHTLRAAIAACGPVLLPALCGSCRSHSLLTPHGMVMPGCSNAGRCWCTIKHACLPDNSAGSVFRSKTRGKPSAHTRVLLVQLGLLCDCKIPAFPVCLCMQVGAVPQRWWCVVRLTRVACVLVVKNRPSMITVCRLRRCLLHAGCNISWLFWLRRRISGRVMRGKAKDVAMG